MMVDFYQYFHPIMLTSDATMDSEDQIYHQQPATVDVFSSPAVSRPSLRPATAASLASAVQVLFTSAPLLAVSLSL